MTATSAEATTIRAELTDLGGGRFRAAYSIANDGSLGVAIEGFDLLFDPSLYLESSLAIVTPPPLASAWDELILGSGVLVPAAYDAIGLSGGIAPGASESGFAVEFVWLGSGRPGTQPFAIFDPKTFAVLESGTTMLIPEPSTLVLIALGAALLAATRSPKPARRRT